MPPFIGTLPWDHLPLSSLRDSAHAVDPHLDPLRLVLVLVAHRTSATRRVPPGDTAGGPGEGRVIDARI